jgi:hypothetical protein
VKQLLVTLGDIDRDSVVALDRHLDEASPENPGVRVREPCELQALLLLVKLGNQFGQRRHGTP